jgi:predicted transcriptional regulator
MVVTVWRHIDIVSHNRISSLWSKPARFEMRVDKAPRYRANCVVAVLPCGEVADSQRKRVRVGKCTTTLERSVRIVCAYVATNQIRPIEVVECLRHVHLALSNLPKRPAVPIKQSVTDKHIVCLEDGEKYELLLPHLKRRHAMNAHDYRARWKLPKHYPMIAPTYRKLRLKLASRMGPGRGLWRNKGPRKEWKPVMEISALQSD